MTLSDQQLENITAKPGLTIPGKELLALPEKVLQFGTGVLLRGLPDYFIDKANRQGLFNGRVVVIKSTDSGGTNAFDKQHGLFTLCVRGLENGQKVEETIINSSISRVVSAKTQWKEILACAANPDMQLIISNTTEVGIVLTDDDVTAAPPASFPGKLLAFLLERFKVFNGTAESGMVIVPTELIINNGTKLKEIVLELARRNKLDDTFIQWLDGANHFCNSLVDRIVPGKLPDNDRFSSEKKLGYTDELMIMAEPFRLWAIESSDEKVKNVLSFAQVDDGLVIAPDIEKFRELKLRLLNGTHTFSSGLAFLAGFRTVREAMGNEHMHSYVVNLMRSEIAGAVTSDSISYEEAVDFASKVVDRFKNPSLDHQWIAITLNYTSKMKLRNVPLLLRHYSAQNSVPEYMALGFAAYILFMKGELASNGKYEGRANGAAYPIQDDQAANLAEKWSAHGEGGVVEAVLADKDLWGTDLTQLNGFAAAVKNDFQTLLKSGAMATIRRIRSIKTTA